MKTRTVAGRTWHFSLSIGRVIGPTCLRRACSSGLVASPSMQRIGSSSPDRIRCRLQVCTKDKDYAEPQLNL